MYEAATRGGRAAPAQRPPPQHSRALGAAVRNYRDCRGCIVLIVGGDGENQVGFLRAGPGVKPPTMSPGSFIYIGPIADGWYLFKTV